MQISTKANLWLVLIAAIWGLTFPLIKDAVSHIEPYSFVFIRFSLAALLFFPFIIKEWKQTNLPLVISGLILGIITSMAELLQTMSLQYINASRCAFINGTFVLMVPLLASLFKIATLRLTDLVCALLCLLGLYILTGADLQQINYGDGLVLLDAVCYALGIVYLQKVTRQVTHYKLLSFYQILFVVPLPLFISAIHRFEMPQFNSAVVLALGVCAIMATVVTMLLQNKYQRHTTATKAALIFMLEPIFASLFGWLINREPITPNIIIGGLIILSSIAISELLLLVNNRIKS